MTIFDNQRDLDALLAAVPFFAAIDQTTRRQLASQFEPVHVTAGEVVISEGATGDGLFLIVSGRLRVFVGTGAAERVLHDLGRGEIVGEIALLSRRPRSATVRAVRDSDLLLLRQSSFDELVEQTPTLLRQVADLLIDRLLAVDRPHAERAGNQTIAVAPAGSNADAAEQVARDLTAWLARSRSVMRLDAHVIDEHLGVGASIRGPGDVGRAELAGFLHSVESSHDHVVYQTDAADSSWSRLCLSQADVVLLAGNSASDHRLGVVEQRALATSPLRCELVLLHSSAPSATSAWLQDRKLADYHHLRAGRLDDVARLARRVTGTACGIVLGGGGSRGFAHLGVLRALEEAGIPVDAVGGTSIGAVMGALVAQDLTDAERIDRAVTAFTRSGPVFSPTLPMIALSSGRRVDRLLARFLGPTLIEDLPLNYFCVSANLTTADSVVHERGILWRAVRASLSLPGIFPPIYHQGDLLVDGGALDNVPAEVMRTRVGAGHVVAVDLTPEVDPVTAAPFDLGFSGWRVLGRRFNPRAVPRRLPNVIDILSRSTALPGVRHRREKLGTDQVDLLVRPPVAGIGLLDFKAGTALIESAYRHALEVLENSQLSRHFVGLYRPQPQISSRCTSAVLVR